MEVGRGWAGGRRAAGARAAPALGPLPCPSDLCTTKPQRLHKKARLGALHKLVRVFGALAVEGPPLPSATTPRGRKDGREGQALVVGWAGSDFR